MNTHSTIRDPYSQTASLDEATLDTVAERLENRGRDEYFTALINRYLDRLQPATLMRVLELGCGTGLVARMLAARKEFAGTIVATDISPGLIDRARKLADRDGVGGQIEFHCGDARELPNGETFDAVIAHTLISHVPHVDLVFQTIKSVLSANGVAVICDGDFASIAMGGSNSADADALSAAISAGMFTNPSVTRRLPLIARQAGLQVHEVVPDLLCEAGSARYFASLFPTLRVLLPKAGVAATDNVNRWIDQLESDIDAEVFFGSMNFYTWYLRSV